METKDTKEDTKVKALINNAINFNSNYCEDRKDPTGTIYAYVPVQVVTNVIAKHGGMVDGDAPPGIAQLKASSR